MHLHDKLFETLATVLPIRGTLSALFGDTSQFSGDTSRSRKSCSICRWGVVIYGLQILVNAHPERKYNLKTVHPGAATVAGSAISNSGSTATRRMLAMRVRATFGVSSESTCPKPTDNEPAACFVDNIAIAINGLMTIIGLPCGACAAHLKQESKVCRRSTGVQEYSV